MVSFRYELLGDSKVAILDNICMDNKLLARKISLFKDKMNCDSAFFVINLTTVVERMAEWRHKLPRVQPFYAVKCNNDPVLLRVLADLGAGFDCASRAEMNEIVERGLAEANRVLYANPCKTRAFIEHANRLHVNMMTFDSAEELVKVKQLHSKPEMILRIAVCDPTASCPLSIKFGCEPPMVEGLKLLQLAKDMGVAVVGISFHVGSGCNDPTAFREAISLSRQLFNLGQSIGHNMHILDIGGGFPGHETEQISFDKIVAVIVPAIDEYFPSEMNVDIIAEPGRFFGSAPISLITNIIAVTKVPASRITKKANDEKKDGYMYYMNDGVYGSFNCILFDHVQPKGEPLFKGSADEENKKFATIVWGPTCDGLDQVEANTKMRRLEEGDWLYYPNMGAYTLVAASNFNGFESPKPFYLMDNTTWQYMYGLNKGNEDGKLI